MNLSGRKKISSLLAVFFPLAIVGGIFLTASVRASSMDLNLTVTGGSPVCGNSIVETGEQCDNGSSNGACPASCSTGCQTNGCGTGPTPPVISNLNVGNITVNGANITWNIDRAALCDLKYGMDVLYASSTISGSGYATAYSVDITGLSTSTTYHYIVNCTDSTNLPATTGDNNFTTLATPPPPQPLVISGVDAASITNTSADIIWNTDRPALCSMHWGINTDYTGGASTEVAYSTSHSSPLSGLAANTTYHYIIDCHDSSNISASSGDNNFRTLAGPDLTPPGNVLGLRSQSGNATTTLFWRNPADPDYGGVIIRRSTTYYPSFTQGTAVYDGQGDLIGSEFSFADTGLTNGVIYYYTVFAYDLARNYASGAGVIGTPLAGVQPPETCATNPSLCPPPPPPAETCATNPALCPPPGQSNDLFFTDFNFSQRGQPLTVGADNRVTAQPGIALDISLPESKVLANTDKMVLNLSIGGKLQTYLFTYDAGQKAYTTVVPAIADAGVYYVSIIALNAQNQSLKIVSGSIEIKAPVIEILPSLPETVNNTVSTTVAIVTNITNAIRENPTIQAIAQAAATPAGQGAAAASVAVSFATTAISIPMLNWWFLLQFLFTQPLKLLGFRKGWGTVYNAITKKPIDLALVRLYDAKSDRLLASRVTDRNGRYIFLVNPGEYYIKIEKPGFDFPSALLKRAHDDGSFLDLYYGEKIVISGEERSAIIANIPIDQEDVQITDAEILKKFSRARLSQALSWLGPALAAVYFLFFPSIFSLGLIVVHVLMLFLFRRLAGRKHKKKHWGVVYAPDGKNPVKRAITRIFSSEYGRMLEFYVTDDQGRYDFLVGNNKYYVTADKPGFGTAKTPILDLSGKKPEELVIAQDLVLPNKVKTGHKEDQEEPPSPPEPVAETASTPEKSPIAEAPPADKAAEPVKAEPILSIPASAGALDLGSLDEIREQMEGSDKEPTEVVSEPETEPVEPLAKPKKTNEGIYG